MRLELECSFDVLVIGAGIAGITAAMEAAELGRSVAIISSADIFSGSSFYPGTWGLGLIGPADDADRQDLADSICTVGCGMADRRLVRTFVDGIHPAIEKVRDMGVKLRRADNAAQKEFIPCFDHKHRDWNGIEFDSARAVFSRRMDELGIVKLPKCEVLELIEEGGRVCGIVASKYGVLRCFGCKALILATGGYGGLFKFHLTTDDVAGMGQYLALKAGCTLVNMEFMQMMPGYLHPAAKTIFNEKTFRFAQLHRQDGQPLLADLKDAAGLLETRSGHGPFTSRLPSRAVDLAMYRAFLQDEKGIIVTYSDAMRRDPPEFVKTYFDWLLDVKHLTMDDPISVGIFAHAANGGIRIESDASTNVCGLFACGEVSGGMHGADRIGGLSTANGLVFGGIAGRSAAALCAELPKSAAKSYEFEPWATDNAAKTLELLREVMFKNAMAERTERGLEAALEQVFALSSGLKRRSADDVNAITAARRIEGQLITATCILKAALLRRESRGSHYRADYAAENPVLARRIIIDNDGAPCARFEEV